GSLLFLAEADDRHFDQATFVTSAKIGVELDAIDEEDAIGSVGETIHVKRVRKVAAIEFRDLHGGANGTADLLLGDTVGSKRFLLAFGGGATVAAHGGDDEGLRSRYLETGDRGADDGLEIGDAAASNRDGNGSAL